MTLDQIESLLVKGDRELFGEQPGTRYKQLLISAHPDKNITDSDRATKLTAKITERYRVFARKEPVTIVSRKRTYRLNEPPLHGDIAQLYPVGSRLLKIPRSAADNDLMEREAEALKRLTDPPDMELAAFSAYALTLYESFRKKDKQTGVIRQINAIENLNAEDSENKGWYSLAQVAKAYPDGVDGRHLAWMWRRLYVACGYAHACGVIHGAIVPEHVMIQPRMHGLMLVDWCYSSIAPVDPSGLVTFPAPPIPAFVSGRKAMYPPEVARKQAPTFGTDLYMAAMTMQSLMGENTPKGLVNFAKGCLVQSGRPEDAWQLKEEFDSLLLTIYGKRTFVPFEMPV